MATLYELADAERQLIEMFESDVIDETTLNDTVEGLDIGAKLEDYCKVIRQLEADSKVFKAEADLFTVKAKRAENGVKQLKRGILNYLITTDKKKADAGLFKVSTRDSKAVKILNESALPTAFLIQQPPKVDKVGIKQAINNGETVTGAELVVNKSITIK